ncbi:MAG: UDP-N-acetylmuramoyl-L-alanyl-D-glutamate--2,6-diaminopimelate ligase [Chloroflexota bacterium]|nr:UDP-N-acetylmuramoyl-L-alanyl-D-glutamate--2,6-diaminopimelate ligase [Dehalococcoidia bacterium]MDW8254363.1 UDP-N-acetylmuramoyl-L-alanyl-D-glutamate--2,6-diaminopimelate ligase [Chloroflexota bacterium]
MTAPRSARLARLAAAVPGARLTGGDPLVTGIQFDSRLVRPGDLFVAVPGTTTDGARFIPQAIAAGAVAVVVQALPEPPAVPAIVVPNAREALAQIAAAFYGHPARQLRVSGVTGTDGKTTTSHLLWAIYEAAGERSGLVTTIRIVAGDDRVNATALTTPDAVTIQALLAEMVDAGCRRAVIEASSHALDQRRLDGVRFSSALCTVLDAEHLNYHGTLEAYIAAKARLFALLEEGGIAVRNAENPLSDRLTVPAHARQLRFGLAQGDVRAEAIATSAAGTTFQLVSPFGRIPIRTRLIGQFNVQNWLAAAAVALAEGIPLEAVARAAEAMPPIKGRLEVVDAGQPFRVVVDFAHTPLALGAVLATLRPLTPGRLIAVFGHAGERDPANRPRMGEIAAAFADVIIVTMDDPYSEDPAQIADAIEAGIAQSGRQPAVMRCLDRREAMRRAFAQAAPHDTVLVAGRGHETVLEWNGRRIPFDDVVVARELLRDLGYHAPHSADGLRRTE